MGVSRTTAYRWWARYQQLGQAGLVDRPSIPLGSPRRTAARLEGRILRLRRRERLGPVRIAARLGVPASTVHRVLVRHRMNRLAWLDRPTGRPIRRDEHPRPGDLVHLDVKKLGRIPAGGGHRGQGRAAGTVNRRADRSGGGYDDLHAAVDDHSRLASVEILGDERAQSCARFWRRAHHWFALHGVTVHRVLTDNGVGYRSRLFGAALASTDVRHRRTRPYRPQTNGKVERFNRTLLEEWAYRRLYRSNAARERALQLQEDILDVGTRREFMRQVTALVGTATMEAFLDLGGPDALDRFSLAVGRPTRVDRATVQHLEAVTATHRELYHHLSSFELVDAVTGHLRGVTRLLRGAQHRVLRRRLAAVAGETAGHAAWLFHDLGDQKQTERYYADAAIATRKAGDPALDAYVSGFKSLVRASDGDPKAALVLARVARQGGARSATATTRAWLAGLEAQALARLHESKACFVALRQAETAIGQARPEEDPPWMYSFADGRLAALAGTCYRQLGKITAAERTLQEALAALDPSCTRRRSEALLELALVQLEKEDIDEACRFAGQSFEAAVAAGSVVGQRRVGGFRSRLDQWSDTAAVRNLDDQLAGLL